MKDEKKIQAIAFSMWVSKYSHIKGPKGEWLTFWDHYEVFLKHEAFEIYINHAENMEPKNKPK